MDRELVIITSHLYYVYLLIENNEVVEFRLDKKGELNLIGSIYKAKIKKLVPSMNAAFVDIGDIKEAFLPIRDFFHQCKEIKVGDEILVQIKRTSIDTKGAKVSCKLTIPGKYLVLLPNNNYISISSKIEDKELKERIKKRVEIILKNHRTEDLGYIIRTSILDASDEDLLNDFLYLKKQWENIESISKELKAPAVIYQDNLKAFTFLRDYAGEIKRIITDDYSLFKRLKNYIQHNFSTKDIKLEFYNDGKTSLFEKYKVERIINKILNPYVWLKSGGYLIIEETEALVSIDVNSGSLRRYKSIEETAIHTNLEAAEEILKQIRLRDLGGIIVIDFIDMREEANREKLINYLKENIKKDKQTIKIKSFTDLGLLELTRKKLDESLIKQLSTKCFACRGKGYQKDIGTILLELEEKIKMLKPFTKLIINVNKELYEYVFKFLKDLNMLDNIEIRIKDYFRENKYEIERIL
jgi:ribonuclease G